MYTTQTLSCMLLRFCFQPLCRLPCVQQIPGCTNVDEMETYRALLQQELATITQEITAAKQQGQSAESLQQVFERAEYFADRLRKFEQPAVSKQQDILFAADQSQHSLSGWTIPGLPACHKAYNWLEGLLITIVNTYHKCTTVWMSQVLWPACPQLYQDCIACTAFLGQSQMAQAVRMVANCNNVMHFFLLFACAGFGMCILAAPVCMSAGVTPTRDPFLHNPYVSMQQVSQ